jgi:hypothetical protein
MTEFSPAKELRDEVMSIALVWGSFPNFHEIILFDASLVGVSSVFFLFVDLFSIPLFYLL